MSYFERTGDETFVATELVSGAWNPAEQHIGPALGLLAHLVEIDRDRRRADGLALGRLSYDILGTVPLGQVSTQVTVLRPGRTIELVEATLSHQQRDIVRVRVWLMKPGDTSAIAAHHLDPIPGPDELEEWDPTDVWPGGYIASAIVRRHEVEPGRAWYWVRSNERLLDEPVSATATAAALFDISNGITVREDPHAVAFPNIDLSVHLFAAPTGPWLGFDTRVSFGSTGFGLTHSVLHDVTGPIGVQSQLLTVRPTPVSE